MICRELTREQSNTLYLKALEDHDSDALRTLCKEDLFFLLSFALKRKDINREWLYQRCREVEASPDGHLDLWARDHYKSTIITFGLTIQDILKDPEITVGIFSHTRPIAKGFLEQIKREFETNSFLKNLFPDILYQIPQKEAPKWSLDGGIIVKRKTNPKEATVEAYGLTDGQPTSRHFSHQIYDDVVTRESVTTPEQIQKTTAAWELSQNLGSGDRTKRRYIGTRYHLFDTYKVMIDRGSVNTRTHTATVEGKYPGTPVLLSESLLATKRRDMGPYTFNTQMMQDPVADKSMGFKMEWLSTYETLGDTAKWNKYILIDPANSKKSSADYTVMEVIGLAPDNNYYLLDAIRDRLNLTQRTKKLFDLHRKWEPKAVGYERYGMQSDIEHMQGEMERENYRFQIIELGGALAKEDRIQKLIPVYEQKRFYTPRHLMYFDYEGRHRDYIKEFTEQEYMAFPVSVHDDMLDCRARILDPKLDAKFPKAQPKKQYQEQGGGGSWMG